MLVMSREFGFVWKLRATGVREGEFPMESQDTGDDRDWLS